MKKVYKIILWTIFVIFVLLIIAILMSPYSYNKNTGRKEISFTANAKVSADSLFRFLGHSENAGKWSVFVDHITTLNSEEVPEGTPGSKRRCFCVKDESGILWDETTLEVVPNSKRKISCYDYKGFPLTTDRLATEQIYIPQSDGSCNITFSLYVNGEQPGFFEDIKISLAAYRVYSIFKRNVENVAAVCEGKPRIHEHE